MSVRAVAAYPRAILAVTSTLFLALAAAVLVLGAPPADTIVREWILAAAAPPVIATMRVVNLFGSWRLLVPGTLVLLAVVPHARRRWWLWLGLMVVAPASETALKMLVARPRPESVSFGFPSGHATAAAAFFGALIYFAGALPAAPRRALRALCVALIALVGIARVVLRAHWPSDVVAGIALGLALASIAVLVASAQALGTSSR